MTMMIEAIYDGKAFFPMEPLFLRPDTKVKMSVVTTENEQPISFLKVARSLQLDGPEDWSAKLDEYLYGNKKAG